MENFADIASRFVAAEAAVQVESPEDVGVAWIQLFRDPKRLQQMGENSRALVKNSRGATERALVEIAKHLPAAAARGSR
jgi:3-deoxy-D-manno-octulosonic-acid transferase